VHMFDLLKTVFVLVARDRIDILSASTSMRVS